MSITFNATGTLSDSSTLDETSAVTWSVSDAGLITMTAGTASFTTAGRIYGGTIGVTATLAPGTPGTASLIAIPNDSGSGPLMPLGDNQWVALGISPWGAYGGLQEPSGTNCVLSGAVGYTLVNNGGGGLGVQSGQGEAGWVRAVQLLSGTVGQRLTAASGSGPNPNATSCAWLTYARAGQGAIQRTVMGHLVNSANVIAIRSQNASNTGQHELFTAAVVNGRVMVGPRSQRSGDRIHPFLLVWNKTTGDVLACTDETVILSSSAVPVNGSGENGIGGTSNTACSSASYAYYASATGSIVEPLSSFSGAADFLSRLGWTVSWKDCPIDSSSIKLPFLPTHWRQVGYNPWTATWNLQETLGSNTAIYTVDTWQGKSVGGWNIIPNSIPGQEYRQPNWNRSSMIFTNGVAQRAQISSLAGLTPPLFDPTGSFATLAYIKLGPTSAGSKCLIGVAGNGSPGTGMIAAVEANNKVVLYCSGSTTTGSQALVDGNFHPVLLVNDVTNSRVKLYTDLEAITGTFHTLAIAASLTASFGFGGFQGVLSTAPSASFNYVSFTTGSNAEQFSTDGVASKFLKDLGWTLSF